FLVNLVLAELKGKAGADEARLVAALEKTMTKIVKHQTADGGFAGNGGWAPVLSLAICNKGIARAKLNGVVVDDKVLARAFEQSKAAAGQPAAAGTPAPAAGAAVASAPPAAGPGGATALRGAGSAKPTAPGVAGGGFGLGGAAGMPGDAGVTLYRFGQGAGNSQDAINALRV